ncbi:MAG: hypothetical protein QOI47_647 [Actinomycetota bacterium]|nr:hypothetical protein [Actinomycetota bacterium]
MTRRPNVPPIGVVGPTPFATTDGADTTRYWPGLDGLRALAVLAVVAFHTRLLGLDAGFLGVDVFLVLSGFLITTGLLGERAATGRVSFVRFYLRRVARLYPALVMVAAFCFVLAIALPRERHDVLRAIPTALVYLSNVVSFDLGPLAHTWSLALEEQFYIVWPISFVVLTRIVRNPRHQTLLIGLAALVSMGLRTALYARGASLARLETSFDTHADTLLVGCALATWVAHRASARFVPSRLASAALAAIAVLFVTGNHERFLYGAGGFLIAGILTAVVVDAVVSGDGGPRLLSWPPLVAIGRRSYGLYLWHVPILWAFERDGRLSVGDAVLGVAAAAVATALSYRYVEVPFLRLKSRLRPTPPAT